MGCQQLVACHATPADEPADRKADEQAIRDTTRQYMAALDEGDIKALAGFWTADGDFVDQHGRKYPRASSSRPTPAKKRLRGRTSR